MIEPEEQNDGRLVLRSMNCDPAPCPLPSDGSGRSRPNVGKEPSLLTLKIVGDRNVRAPGCFPSRLGGFALEWTFNRG